MGLLKDVMKIYLVKEHEAFNDTQRESVVAAYLDKKNAEQDAQSHIHGVYTHWLVDELEVKDARSVMRKKNSKRQAA